MAIIIAGKSYATRRPQDLDAKLVAATGCSAAEAQRWLHGSPRASHVAAALVPFMVGADAPVVQELAALIAADDVAAVAVQVAALYAAVPDLADPQPPAETHGDGA